MEKNQSLLELEALDELISKREDELNGYTDSLKTLLERTSAFIKDYKDKVSSFTQVLNKEIEAIYNSIDSFETYYANTKKEIKNLENVLLTRESEFLGDEAKALEAMLRSKLQSESDKLKNDVNATFDSVIVEYKKAAEQLDKASQRLSKLKNKEILK